MLTYQLALIGLADDVSNSINELANDVTSPMTASRDIMPFMSKFVKICFPFSVQHNDHSPSPKGNLHSSLIPLKDIPSINLLYNVIQTSVIPIGDDGLAHHLELGNIIDYETAEEG